MATLTFADSFDHQIDSITSPFAQSALRFYDLGPVLGNIGFDTTNKRTGLAALTVTEDGTNATYIGRTVSTQVLCVSFYFRATTNPGAKSQLFHTVGATNNVLVGCNTDGTVFVNIGGVSEQTGPDVIDSAWHLIDIRFDCSTGTYTADVSVDGTALTQSSRATAASTMTSWRLGSNTAAHNLTYWVDDFISSVTAGDHPLGPHRVESFVPTDDSADSVYNAGNMRQGDGTALSSSNKGFQYLDEWPPTTGINNADTVTQDLTGTGDFVEVEFGSVTLGTGESIGLVIGRAALQSDGTSANNGTTRVVDSGNTTLTDLYSGDMSETSAQYVQKIIPDPGGDGWSATDFNGVAMRVGLSSDATPDPEWLALMLEVAILEPAGGGDVTATVDTLGALAFAGATVGALQVIRATVSTAGLLALAGQTVTTSVAVVVAVTPGTLALAGATVGVVVSSSVSPGTLAFAGQTVNTTAGRTEQVTTPGALTFAGQTAGVVIAATSSPGALAFAGQTVGTTVALTVTVSPGALTFAGSELTTDYLTPVTPGALVFAGQTVTTRVAQVVTVTPGALVLAGQTVNTLEHVRAAITPGVLAFQGQTVGAGTVLTVAVTPGTLAFAGRELAFGILAALNPGTLAFVGADVGILTTSPVGPQIITREGTATGGAAAGDVLSVTREGAKAGGAASGNVTVLTREGT